MAGRSDRSSVLPRFLKRHLSLTSSGDKHQDGVVRRLFIAAHAHSEDVRDKASKSGFIVGESVDDATQKALTDAAQPK